LQNGMQFPGQKRGWVMMLKLKGQVTSDDAGLQDGAGRRAGVYLDLDGEYLLRMGGETQLVGQAAKTDKGAVDGLPVVDFKVRQVAFIAKSLLNSQKAGSKIIPRNGLFQGKVQVFRIAGGVEKKTEGGPSVKGQRDHHPGPLEYTQNSGLQIFPDLIPPLNRGRGGAEDLEKIFFQSCS
jgi:hypothetical protein